MDERCRANRCESLAAFMPHASLRPRRLQRNKQLKNTTTAPVAPLGPAAGPRASPGVPGVPRPSLLSLIFFGLWSRCLPDSYLLTFASLPTIQPGTSALMNTLCCGSHALQECVRKLFAELCIFFFLVLTTTTTTPTSPERPNAALHLF